MSSVKHLVAQSQGRIIDMLSDCERRIAALYVRFAAAFPLSADFWNMLVREEIRHAQLLEGLHSILDRGFLIHDIGRFDQERMKEFQALLDDARQRVSSGAMDEAGAFATALQVEHSLLESRFYAEVSSDAPEFAAVCKVMQDETEQHIAKLQAALEQKTGAGLAARKQQG